MNRRLQRLGLHDIRTIGALLEAMAKEQSKCVKWPTPDPNEMDWEPTNTVVYAQNHPSTLDEVGSMFEARSLMARPSQPPAERSAGPVGVMGEGRNDGVEDGDGRGEQEDLGVAGGTG